LKGAILKYAVLLLLLTVHLTFAVADETAIRQADQAWAKAVAAKSIEQVVSFYDEEVVTAGSAMPPTSGLSGIHTMWESLFAMLNFALTWKVDEVIVLKCGMIAYSMGKWRGGRPNDVGSYFAVWRKQRDGQWKVLVDSAWYTPQSK
jgi:ketosteroid isomerase-like protein